MRKKVATLLIHYQNEERKMIITRKAIKRIIFRIENGEIHVSAPYFVNDKTILSSFYDLPKSFLSRLDRKKEQGQDYIYLLGKKYPLCQALETPKEHAITYINQEDLEKKLSSVAKEVIEQRVRFYEEKMKITPPYRVRIRKMKTRYGTNSRKTHTLTFALLLVHYPLSVIDAIVVHELAHHRHFDHSDAFYQEVYTYYPHYDVEHRKLKKGCLE